MRSTAAVAIAVAVLTVSACVIPGPGSPGPTTPTAAPTSPPPSVPLPTAPQPSPSAGGVDPSGTLVLRPDPTSPVSAPAADEQLGPVVADSTEGTRARPFTLPADLDGEEWTLVVTDPDFAAEQSTSPLLEEAPAGWQWVAVTLEVTSAVEGHSTAEVWASLVDESGGAYYSRLVDASDGNPLEPLTPGVPVRFREFMLVPDVDHTTSVFGVSTGSLLVFVGVWE